MLCFTLLTRGVQLEGHLVSLDGDRHGLLGDGAHHGRIRVGLHIRVGDDVGLGVFGAGGVAAIGGAGLRGAGDVRVVLLRAQATVGLDPIVGGVVETTVAAQVATTIHDGVAVD